MKTFRRLYADHAKWSNKTFGEDRGPMGSLNHLELEVKEAKDNPGDIMEYVDCLFLVLDASRRAGFTLADLTEAGFQKLEVLKLRTYERMPEGVPSQHVH